MRVKNVNGTSELDCKCGSWLEHWKKFSGTTLPTYCYEKSCTKNPTLGAHVQKEAELNESWYTEMNPAELYAARRLPP
jgi:hypothetical protein